MNKNILLSSFISPEKKESFVSHLQTKFNVKPSDIYYYHNITDPNSIIVVFKLILVNGEYLNLKKEFSNAIQIHKKSNCIYSINALNKLIEQLNSNEVGNIDHKSYKLNWSEYQNKLILITNAGLVISDIKQFF